MRWMKCCWKNVKQVRLKRAASLLFPRPITPLSILFRPIFSLLILALLTAEIALPAFSQDITIRSQANVVSVPVLVKDPTGQIVYGLSADDFVIEDNGVAQTVHMDDTPDAQPLSLVIVIQKGRRANYEFDRIRTLAVMLEPLFATGHTKVALVEFDSGVKTVRDFTTNFNLIEDDLEKLHPGDNGAAILDAAFLSEKLLERTPDGTQRALLLISETRDHGSVFRKDLDDVVRALGNKNTVVTTLAFSPSLSNILDTGRGKNKDEMKASPDLLAPFKMGAAALKKNTPRTLAAMTGGEYQPFSSERSFETRMTAFTNHLESRYQLSIQPKNPNPGLHEIRVRLKNPSNDTVLARSSYWAEGTK
jgi:VWFA-related protein